MNSIGWLLLILSGPGRLAAEVPPAKIPTAEELTAGRSQGREPTNGLLGTHAQASSVGSESAWRRTRDGWERPAGWTFQRKARRPALHPVVVGLLEFLLAAAALIAFSEARNPQSRPKSKKARRSDPPRR